jgi:hypothetical protein
MSTSRPSHRARGPQPPQKTSARPARTVPHSSITPPESPVHQTPRSRTRNAVEGLVRARPWVVSALAAAGVFATVLSSQPVYGQPPQRGPRSTSAPAKIESANTPKAPPKSRAHVTQAPSSDHGTSDDDGATDRRVAATRSSVAPASAAPAPATPAAARARVAPSPRVAQADPERDEPVRVAMRTAAAPPATAPGADAPADGPEPATTEARTTGTGTGTEPAEPSPSRDRRRPAGKRTVIEDEFLVEGKLEKPSAYYILRRSSLDYDWARLDAKFSPLVLESVQDPLF